jgi:hypothetical protein
MKGQSPGTSSNVRAYHVQQKTIGNESDAFLIPRANYADNSSWSMLRRSIAISIVSLGILASSRAQVSGTVETYFQSDAQKRGIQQLLSWAELEHDVNSHVRATVSYIRLPGFDMLDESYIGLSQAEDFLRLGRIRTAFGFSDWSDAYYNGFNHIPLIRSNPLIEGLRLMRDDAGAEVTFGGPKLQVQASMVDSSLNRFQYVPREISTSTMRAQTTLGAFIVGLDALWRFSTGDEIVGIDVRWSAPHLVVRGEFMAGIGSDDTASGFYVDGTYRVPGVERTQLVGRIERYSSGDQGDFMLQTLGLREIVSPNFTANVNYGWGSGGTKGNAYTPVSDAPGLQGWSARLMFQIHF